MLGLSLGLMGVAVRGSSSSSMLLGANLNWVVGYEAPVPFANVFRQSAAWSQEVGAGAWTLTRENKITSVAVGTDEFRAKVFDGTVSGMGAPAGTYTIRWSGTAEVALGTFVGAGTYTAPSGGTGSFTQAWSNDYLYVWAKGGTITDLEIILPDHVTSYDAGDQWNSAYISYLQKLGVRVIRFMDWNWTSQIKVDHWSDRTTESCLSYVSDHTYNKEENCVPYEAQIDLANKLNVTPWFHIPVYADDTYVTSLATLVEANLNSGLRPRYALGNEVWNVALPWVHQSQWVKYLDLTKMTGTVHASDHSVNSVAHGLSENDQVEVLTHPDNTGDIDKWWLRYVHVVDVDNFTLWESANQGGTQAALSDDAAGETVYYVDINEAGKNTNLDTQYGLRCVEIWDLIDAVHGAANYDHLIESWHNTPSSTSGRLGATGVSGRCDLVATAPYSNGSVFQLGADIATGTVTPKLWWYDGSAEAHAVTVGLYTNGSTPTLQNVLDGNGTGFLQGEQITLSTGDDWNEFTQMTGLSNGTDYDLWFVFEHQCGDQLSPVLTFTASATPSTETGFDSYANQLDRDKYLLRNFTQGKIQSHLDLLSGETLTTYECGTHFTINNSDLQDTFCVNYSETDEYAEFFEYTTTLFANMGIKEFTKYKDLSTGSFGYNRSEYAADTPVVTDIDALNGSVSSKAIVDIANDSVTQETEVSTPYALIDVNDSNTGNDTVGASVTYAITAGNDAGRFSINSSTGVISLTDKTSLNWSTLNTFTLTVSADNGWSKDWATISVTLGVNSNWYEADAQLVFDSIDDTDNAVMNAIVGPDGALTGTGATIASGLWAMNEADTYAGSTSTESIAMDEPWLMATVFDRYLEVDTFTYDEIWKVGLTGNRMALYTSNGTDWKWSGYETSAITLDLLTEPSAGTPVVLWLFYDGAGTFTEGYNQTSGNTLSRSITASAAMNNSWNITTSKAKHGSFQLVGRTGMTLTQAKAIVQKMQDYHSIT